MTRFSKAAREFARRLCLLLIASLSLSLIAPSLAVAEDEHPVITEVKKQLGDRDPSKALILMVGLKPKEGMAAKVVQAMKKATAPTRAEAGNMAYLLLRSPTDPSSMMVYERWKSVRALSDHLAQPYIVELLGKLEESLAEPPTLTVMQPVSMAGQGKANRRPKGSGKAKRAAPQP